MSRKLANCSLKLKLSWEVFWLPTQGSKLSFPESIGHENVLTAKAKVLPEEKKLFLPKKIHDKFLLAHLFSSRATTLTWKITDCSYTDGHFFTLSSHHYVVIHFLLKLSLTPSNHSPKENKTLALIFSLEIFLSE